VSELGLDVTVYERSGAELEQRGAGIGLLPAILQKTRLDADLARQDRNCGHLGSRRAPATRSTSMNMSVWAFTD